MSDRREEILTRYRELGSYRKVAEELGISPQRVHQIITGYQSYAQSDEAKQRRREWKRAYDAEHGDQIRESGRRSYARHREERAAKVRRRYHAQKAGP